MIRTILIIDNDKNFYSFINDNDKYNILAIRNNGFSALGIIQYSNPDLIIINSSLQEEINAEQLINIILTRFNRLALLIHNTEKVQYEKYKNINILGHIFKTDSKKTILNQLNIYTQLSLKEKEQILLNEELIKTIKQLKGEINKQKFIENNLTAHKEELYSKIIDEKVTSEKLKNDLANILLSTDDVIWKAQIDKNSNSISFSFVSDSIKKLTGYEPEYYLSKRFNLNELLYHEDLKKVAEFLNLFDKKKLQRGVIEFNILNSKSNPIPVSLTITKMFSSKYKLSVLGIMQNLTYRQDLDKMTTRTLQLETHKFLTSGIAHNVNNLMTIIQSNFELTTLQHNIDETLVKTTITAISEIKKLIKNIMIFSHNTDEILPELISINNLIHSCIFEINKKEEIPHNIEVRYADPDIKFNADYHQLEIAITHLLKNSIEATTRKGNIKISIKKIIISSNNHSYSLDIPSNQYIKLIIKDTGDGIDSHILPKVFNMFFSTKAIGRGIGLSLTEQIINLHKGFIFLSSKKNKWTKVEILLPINH